MNGSLVFFLGAGISKGFGLPDWFDFTNSLRKLVGLKKIDEALSQIIQQALDEFLDKINNDEIQKIMLVKKVLYPSDNRLEVSKAYSNHLLISISSLFNRKPKGGG